MGKTCKILRQSIFLFLQNYHYFTSAPTFLAFPFAIFALLSRCYVPSLNVFPSFQTRLRSSLLIASRPRMISSDLVGVQLSQTILTYIFVSPFAYSFLLLAKSSVIVEFINQRNPKQASSSKPSLISIFKPLIFTQLLNSLLMISLNAICFFVLFVCFNFLDNSRLSSRGALAIFSSIGAIAYSLMLAYAYIICNLSLLVSGLEKHGGFVSVFKACALMHGRSPSSTAVSLAVLMNTALVGVEALFHYRVYLSAYSAAIDSAIVMEGLFIAYMYAILLVLDTVITCVFWKRWGEDHQIDPEDYYMYYSQEQDKLFP